MLMRGRMDMCLIVMLIHLITAGRRTTMRLRHHDLRLRRKERSLGDGWRGRAWDRTMHLHVRRQSHVLLHGRIVHHWLDTDGGLWHEIIVIIQFLLVAANEGGLTSVGRNIHARLAALDRGRVVMTMERMLLLMWWKSVPKLLSRASRRVLRDSLGVKHERASREPRRIKIWINVNDGLGREAVTLLGLIKVQKDREPVRSNNLSLGKLVMQLAFIFFHDIGATTRGPLSTMLVKANTSMQGTDGWRRSCHRGSAGTSGSNGHGTLKVGLFSLRSRKRNLLKLSHGPITLDMTVPMVSNALYNWNGSSGSCSIMGLRWQRGFLWTSWPNQTRRGTMFLKVLFRLLLIHERREELLELTDSPRSASFAQAIEKQRERRDQEQRAHRGCDDNCLLVGPRGFLPAGCWRGCWSAFIKGGGRRALLEYAIHRIDNA
ncbi:MAG: hypothetical protein J3Q66DRAFT_197433 [Benniella sp.]|nr:MAG: hypothetical protein J3Q66DRAFT_197433 [Benniella sp.]